jgi:hypothetical protein
MASLAPSVHRIAALLTAWTIYMPACGFLFQCGCRAFWNGGADHCSINVGPPPACPWCASWTLGAIGLAISTWVIVAAWRHWPDRPGAPWVAIAPGYFLAGLITFLITPYPHFIVRGLRALLSLPDGPYPIP